MYNTCIHCKFFDCDFCCHCERSENVGETVGFNNTCEEFLPCAED